MLRSLSGLILSLVLVVTSVTMAQARGQMAAGTEMVICSGYGVITVTLDADGNPVDRVHPCPDCLPGLAAALLPGVVRLPAPTGRLIALVRPEVIAGHAQACRAAQARGPPLPV